MTIPRNLGTLAQAAGNATGAAPQLNLGVNATTLGAVLMYGNTSGNITIQPAAATTTWTMTFPSNSGTANYLLTTNGSGVTSWAAGTGVTTIYIANNFGGL